MLNGFLALLLALAVLADAMVSNLLVVLCGDEPAQPVVNSGSLY